MKNIILFDLDGTLTDPKVGITKSVRYALRHFGIYADDLDELCKFIGPPMRKSFKEFYGFDDEAANRATEKYRERFLEKGIYENVMYGGIDVMLKNLKASDKTLFLATSKPTEQAERVLEHFGLAEYFSFVSGAELDGERSEKWEVIQYALERNDIRDRDACIMVGDRKYDITGAKSAGIDSVGVLYGYGGLAELSDAGADYIVKNVAELTELLCNRL